MDRERQHAIHANAEIDPLQAMEAGHQDAGAGEQRQRERHLRRGQRPAQPRQPAGAGGGSRLLAQGVDG